LIKSHLQLSAGFKAVNSLKLEGESQNIDTIEHTLNRANVPAYIKLTESETQKICSHSAQKTIPVEMNLEAPQQSCYHFHLHQLSDLLGLRPESDLQDF